MSSGPDTSSAGSTGPGRVAREALRALFEVAVIGFFTLAAVFVPVAINPHLLAPSVMVVGFGLGTYALSLVRRRRWAS